MEDFTLGALFIVFGIATFIYIRAQTGQVVPALLVTALSPLVFLCLNGLVTMCVCFITTEELVLIVVPFVFTIACLVFAIKYALDKKRAVEAKKSSVDEKKNSV